MSSNRFPKLEQVKEMKVRHGKPIAFERSGSSHGMMAFSGQSDTYTLKEIDGQYVILYVHSSEMDGTTETLYRADADALQKLTEIADRENLYAWGEMHIDPADDKRPVVFDYSSSLTMCIITDDRYANRFYINCETARYYGGGSVIDELTDIIYSYVTDERKLDEKSFPPTDPRVIAFKKQMFTTMAASPETSGWTCPQCNLKGNRTNFCQSCGTPRPEQTAQPEPEKQPEQEWTYDGGEWKCPKCNGEGNTGKFCLTCGSWRPDLDPDKDKKPEPEPQQPAFPMVNGMMKAMGLLPKDKPDEQLQTLLEKETQHGKLLTFEHSSWSNGMSMNSHQEQSTRLYWSESGEPVVVKRFQQGTADALISEYKASEKVLADLEKFIRERNITNLAELKYERSKDPFANVTDTSGGSTYSIVFDESSVGGRSFEAFTIDPSALWQHGGAEIAGSLSDLTSRLTLESQLIKSYTETPKPMGMSGFMGMGMLMQQGGTAWTCSECGHECNGGKFCNNCGSPKK